MENVYILHHIAPKKPQFFFAWGGLSGKCVYIEPLCPPEKLNIFSTYGGLSEKCVYMAIWHPKNNQYFFLVRSNVLDRIFFTLQKKAIFHLCLIVCPILIGPLSSCPILCHLQLFWRRKEKSADFLSAPGEGCSATLHRPFNWYSFQSHIMISSPL